MKLSPRLFVLFALFFCTTLWSCNGCFQNTFVKESAPITENLTVDIPVSTFNIPIHYQIKNFETWINAKISGKFLETTINPLQNKKDEAILIFNKTNPIRISTAGNNLVCIFPLEVIATLTKSRFGKMMTKQVEPLKTEVVIQLTTTVALDGNWDLITKFKIKSVQWIREPVLQVGPVKQNLKRKLTQWLEENETKLTKMLDKEMKQSVSLEPAISKIWYDLQKPMIIHRKKPMAWMKFSCKSIEGKIVLQPDAISCFTSVQAKMTMMTDTANLQQPSKLPPFKQLSTESSTSDFYLYAFSSFDEINEEVNKLFKGKIISAKGYTVSIKNIRTYASEAGLSVEVKTGKDIKGKMVASGKLEFNPTTQTMVINNFEYNVSSNSSVVNAGDEFLHDMIRDTIASKLILNLDSIILTLPPLVEKAIAKGKSGKAIDISFDNLYVKDCDITMDKDLVHFKIHAVADADLNLKKLKTGKKLNIKTTSVKKK